VQIVVRSLDAVVPKRGFRPARDVRARMRIPARGRLITVAQNPAFGIDFGRDSSVTASAAREACGLRRVLSRLEPLPILGTAGLSDF